MTRRRLWLLTTACCALLALPTILRLLALITPSGASWAATTTASATRRVGASLAEGLHSITTRARSGEACVACSARHAPATAVGAGTGAPADRAPAIVTPTLPPRVLANQRLGLHHITSDLVDRLHASAHTVLELAMLVLAFMALAVLVADRFRQRRRAAAPQRARRLAERGAGVGVIARRTGLAQDAVRQLIHPRRENDRAAFADLLATSLDLDPGRLNGTGAHPARTEAPLLSRGKGQAYLAPRAAATPVVPSTGSRSDR
jgi:hypothetical protein